MPYPHQDMAAAGSCSRVGGNTLQNFGPAGTGEEELCGYLSALQAEADALQLNGKGAAADAALTPLAAAASEMLESGEQLL